jgi:YD repeat-containing protein
MGTLNGINNLVDFHLTYDYFNSNSGNPANISERLRLLSVQQSGGNFSLPAYQFVYTSNDVQDKVTTNDNYGFLSDLSKGLLKEVHYPTGGYTSLVFENNFNNLGVRIKTISNYDNANAYNVRSFNYINGRLLVNENYTNTSYDITNPVDASYTVNNVTSTIKGSYTMHVVNHTDVSLLGENSSDYLLGYDEVIENYGLNGEFGKTEHYFYNDPIPGSGLPVAVDAPANVSTTNGALHYDYVYKNVPSNGNVNFVLVEKKEYDLQKAASENFQFSRHAFSSCNNTYTISSDWVQNSAQIGTVIDDFSNQQTVSKYFYYNTTDMQLASTTTTDSKGQTITTAYQYPSNYPGQPEWAPMISANILSPIIKTTVTANSNPVSTVSTDYYSPSTGIYVPRAIQTNYGSNAFETRQTFYNYDSYGNLLEQAKTNDILEVFLWGYNSRLMVAKIKGSTYAAASALVSQSTLNNPADDNAMRTELNKLRTGLPGAFVETYTYLPNVGVTSRTDAAGRTVYYEYDALQRLDLIRDQNNNIVKKFCYNYNGQQINCAGENLPPPLINVTYTNSTAYNSYLRLTNVATGVAYPGAASYFTLTANTTASTTLTPQIPLGTYNAYIYSDGPGPYTFQIYSSMQSGVNSWNASNISLCATCANVSIH